RMIGTATARFGAPAIPLSSATKEQLVRVSRIDWSQATFGIDGGDDQQKYLAIYYYVKAQRQELERQLHNDLMPLSVVQVLPTEGTAQPDPGKSEPVPTVCRTVFDDDNYLCALDLKLDSSKALPDVKLTDAMLSEIAAKAKISEEAPPAPKLRKRDRWLKTELDAINRRIDQSDQRKELWALRDRMDDMEGRMDDISLQVDELRTDRTPSGTTENPVASLSGLTGRNVTVRFGKGTSDLEQEERNLLDEVVRSMKQGPTGRLLVTGYADRTGDPALNLVLSERRAKAVRAYLIGQGIAGSRVLMNYYGASQSTGSNPAERRVELEWVR
ncbi:MAG: OmpA family protein, partial [Flavobacteriales bacterium]